MSLHIKKRSPCRLSCMLCGTEQDGRQSFAAASVTQEKNRWRCILQKGCTAIGFYFKPFYRQKRGNTINRCKTKLSQACIASRRLFVSVIEQRHYQLLYIDYIRSRTYLCLSGHHLSEQTLFHIHFPQR